MSKELTVALSTDFFKSFLKLPQSIQGKVSKFIINFQQNPKMTGINYEKIKDAADKNMRSVRIDDNYRGVVLKPEDGNLYMLLWIDTHDEAYVWAQRHKCTINGHTGSVQIYDVVNANEVLKERKIKTSSKPALYNNIKDTELMKIGVPEELIPTVRAVYTEEELDQIETVLPSEAYEALFMIAAGDTVQQILNEREVNLASMYDTNDFDAAIQRIDSRSRFVVVENETELSAALNSSLELWRIFLHPSQLRLVSGRKTGPVRVLGGAGTGKTVVAMHRAKWLAKNYAKEDEKILFTTFTRNLAVDIEDNLRKLCSPEEFKKIEVINIDGWILKYLKSKKYGYKIIYNINEELWKIAISCKPSDLKHPDSFFKDEWQRTVQAQGIETLDQYKVASRIGRGTPLSRSERIKIWQVFEEYKNQLLKAKEKEVSDAYRDAAAFVKHDSEKNIRKLPYKSVIIDEAQDMGMQAFKLLRTLVEREENDLFIVGDGHQRIYGINKVVLTKCGVDVRGRARKLKINYRTTEEIRNRAIALLENISIDDLDGGEDNQRLYKSLTHGEPPTLKNFGSFEEQIDFIMNIVSAEVPENTTPPHICISARTNQEVDSIQKIMAEKGITVQKIDKDKPDNASSSVIRVATLHRAKGLEFDIMIVASVNEGLVPLDKKINESDEAYREQIEIEERSLLYVGITRARKTAYILSYGPQSRFLK